MRAHATLYFISLGVLCAAGALLAVWMHQYIWLLLPFAGLLFLCALYQPRLIFYLLIASIPWSVEFNFNRGLGTDLPDEPLMLLTTFGIIAYLLFFRPPLLSPYRRSALLLLLVLQMAWILIAVFVSTHPVISAKFLLAKSWYLGAFVLAPIVLFQQKQHIKNTAIILVTSMMLLVVVTMMRHYGYGFTFDTINPSLEPFFRNHVNYSALLVCTIPLLVVAFTETRTKGKKWLYGLVLMLALAALYLSYARGAWLALLVGIGAYWLIKKKALLPAYIFSFIIVGAGLFWLVQNNRYLKFAHDYNTTVFHTDFRQHLVATYQFKDVSTAERFYRWIAGVRMIKYRWQTGYGPNTFYAHYKSYAVPAFKTWVSKNEERSTVHNYFLLTIVEQGLMGLLLLLILLGYMFYTAQKIYLQSDDVFWKRTAVCVGIILSMVCAVNFLSDLVETDKLGSVFYLCLALLVVGEMKLKRSKLPE